MILPSQSPTGKLQGIDPALLKILAEKLKFVPDFFFSRPSNFNLTTFTWTEGRVQKVRERNQTFEIIQQATSTNTTQLIKAIGQ